MRVRHAFAPADTETAVEPECEHPDGCSDRGLCGKTCGFADQLKGIRVMPRPKPEAPACSACGGNDPKGCPFCKKAFMGPWVKDDEFHRQGLDEPEAPGLISVPHPYGGAATVVSVAVSRPPFALTYVRGSGARTRIALPGEASVAVVDGSLVISHASGVLGIAEVMPCELEN